MIDARHFAVEDTLRNGEAVAIRAVRPDDRDRVAKAFRQLDPGSIYTRFFAFKSELSAAELAQIGAMDFLRDVMLIATIPVSGDEIVIGSARYIGNETADHAGTAEVAFTVEEDYQGLGLAGRLLAHLVEIARESGIERFEADVLPGNAPMLAVFSRSGLPMRRRRETGVVHLTLELKPPASNRA
jgi:RimJ/RimL family protein N-acetyltransferase